MAEPFKHFINAALIRDAAAQLRRAAPSFDAARFTRLATRDLDTLELKARALHVATAFEATLPEDFDVAAQWIEAALAPAHADDELSHHTTEHEGLAGWILWPAGEFVVRRGMQSPERALQALHAITQRFTAEFAIRPFILEHPELVYRTLHEWVHDDSSHVRRLVSEGSRPRLPWGLQLKTLVADPSPTLPLLLALQDDTSAYVRRSVANHLNDIAKDHPTLIAEWLETHLPTASAERRALLRHASRTLIKRGDSRVLSAWGLGGVFKGRAKLTIAPARVAVGGHLAIAIELTSAARRAQRLAVDYAVHHVKADGRTTPKVFKGWVLELAAGETRTLNKRHSLKPITTRRYHAGAHAVEVLINGRSVARAGFELRL